MGDVQLNHTLLSVAASLTACFGSKGSAVEPVESPMALPVPELIATAFAKESLRGAAPAGDDLAPNDATVSTSAATTRETASLGTGARGEREDMGGSFRAVRARRSGTPLTVTPMDPQVMSNRYSAGRAHVRLSPPVVEVRGRCEVEAATVGIGLRRVEEGQRVLGDVRVGMEGAVHQELFGELRGVAGPGARRRRPSCR